MTRDLLPGFETVDVDVAGARVHARVAGSGSPVLLLHGYPQTHVMWHRVAPLLAERHTVVVSDLRGYGRSAKPPVSDDHLAYAKRSMAADQVGLMAALGHERFAAAGHDRGARVLHRLCLDAPHAVRRAAVLDIVPTLYAYEHVDRALAQAYWHWFFLSQPGDLPEQLIGADPGGFLRGRLAAWSGPGAEFDRDAVEDYVRCFSEPAAIAASCEDYRAAATVDLEADSSDRNSGRRVECPLLVLWGTQGFVGRAYDVLAVWREFATQVQGEALDCGHFVPEEVPEATAEALLTFFAEEA